MKNELIEKLLLKLIDSDDENHESKQDKSGVFPWSVGKKYFIRTVTMYLVGKVIAVTDKEILMTDVSWVTDTGRFNAALRTGTLDELEPFVNDVIINRSSVIDATVWDHELPREPK